MFLYTGAANNVLLRRAGLGPLVPQICDFGSALYLGNEVSACCGCLFYLFGGAGGRRVRGVANQATVDCRVYFRPACSLYIAEDRWGGLARMPVRPAQNRGGGLSMPTTRRVLTIACVGYAAQDWRNMALLTSPAGRQAH